MQTQIIDNGNLVLTADNEDRAYIASEQRQYGYLGAESAIQDDLFCNCEFEFILPEDIGALTDAPIISDGENVWWFPDYMITDPWALLKQGRVEFVKG